MGRRKLTLTSLAGVILALIALGGGFKYSELTSPRVVNGTSDGRCDTYKSCFDCVADGGCGFCPSADGSTGYCVAGNSTAPAAGAAAGMCGDASMPGNHSLMQMHSWDLAETGVFHSDVSGGGNSSWYWQSCPAKPS